MPVIMTLVLAAPLMLPFNHPDRGSYYAPPQPIALPKAVHPQQAPLLRVMAQGIPVAMPDMDVCRQFVAAEFTQGRGISVECENVGSDSK